jgi:hypothetical protein
MESKSLDRSQLIEILDKQVTCEHWFACKRCKTFKMAIAFIKELGEIDEPEHNRNN